MMNKNKLIEKYNTKDATVVVTNFPPKGTIYGKGGGGVASFAKNTLIPMAKNGNKIIVLADIIDNSEKIYEDEGMLVIRVWRRNSFNLYKQLISWLNIFSTPKKLLVEFEFALYGDFMVAGVFPLFLLYSKLTGKKVFLVVHQVITKLSNLSGHIGLAKHSFLTNLLGSLIKIYYKGLSFSSEKIIVLESEFKKRLIKSGIESEKVEVIKHGVDTNLKAPSKFASRKKLGIKQNEFVVLSFGFLTWYKGSDITVKAAKYMQKKNLRVILAGGESMTQNKKTHYKKYIKNLYESAQKYKNTKITGFIDEKDIATYYAAADYVVLPYRTYMSSSGPLSLALSYNKPCILSNRLKNWFDEENSKNLFCKPSAKSLAKTLSLLRDNKSKQKEIQALFEDIRWNRSFENMAINYENVIKGREIAPAKALAFAE